MSVVPHWFLPTPGDGRSIVDRPGESPIGADVPREPDVADLIGQYHDIGTAEFVLSGYPHLEAAYWFGEGVRPILARRGLL